MKVKTVFDFPLLQGLNQYESTLLDYNNIKQKDISKLLPDLNQYIYTIDDYLEKMEPIQKGKDFVKYIKDNLNKTFFIIGDYDCDGIMATCIISYALTLCGAKVVFTAPNRFVTGYGMKKSQVDEAIKANADIIITVDNGITAFDAISYAHQNGLKVLITDHHNPQGTNDAELVIDPWYNEDKFKGISGATVAMKLAYELYKEFNFDKYFMHNFVALAGITCLSDVMPMLEENRILIKSVTEYMNKEVYKKGSFINRLAKLVSFYDPKSKSDPYFELPGTFRDFNKANIDFYLVPIVNAVNRVTGNVNELIYDIMDLFYEDFPGLPSYYSDLNNKRKYMKSELLSLHKKSDAKAVVEKLNPGKYEDDYSGIAGLVASTIVETENKPALIGIDLDKEPIHFSGRSVSGFNLFEALTKIKSEHPELSLTFGGHAEALGAAMNSCDIPKVQEYLSEEFSKVKIEEVEPVYVALNNVNEFKEVYYKYWPFGNKFEFPKFYCEGIPTYINKSDKCFYLDSVGNTKIQYFTKDIGDRIGDIVFKKTKKIIKCILSMYDENNEAILKIEKIL